MSGPNAAPSFLKGFLKLFSGLVVVQVLNFAFSLILPRYYSPADYALFGLFTAVVFILIEVISLKLELAVYLPEEEREAIEIVHVIFLVSVLLSIFFAAAALVFYFMYGPVFILLPGLLMVFGFIQGLNAWFTRQKNYEVLNTYRIVQAIFTPLFALLFIIYFNWEFGLVFGFVLGQLSGLLYLLFRFDHIHVSLMNISLAKKYLSKFNQFPKFGVPSSLVNSVSRNGLVFFIERFFGVANAGYYTMASRLLNTPAGMYQSSLSQVYIMQAAKLRGDALKQYTKTIVRFGFFLGIAPVLLLLFFGPGIFSLLFGETWTEGGKMTQYIILWIFTAAVVNPVGLLVDIKQRLRFELGWNIILLLLRGAAVAGGILSGDVYLALLAFSVVSVVMNLYLLWYIIKLTDEPAD